MHNETEPSIFSRSCPTCTTQETKGPQVFSQPEAESFSFDDLSKHWFGFFKSKPFFTYHRCSECNLLYNPKYFGEKQLSYLYSNMPDNTAGLSENFLRKTQKGYFNFFKKFAELEGEFLELGPDIGLFTENCVTQGKFSKYWFFEPNVNVHPRLKNLVGSTPVEIHPELLDFDSVKDGSISAAVLIHVVDHLTKPNDILKTISRKLKKGGKLLTVTHDESSVLAKALGRKWPAYCLQHPQLYTPKTMKLTLEKVGLSVVANEYSANYFPVSYLVKHGLFAFGMGSPSLPFEDKFWLPLKLGNFMTMAEKI